MARRFFGANDTITVQAGGMSGVQSDISAFVLFKPTYFNSAANQIILIIGTGVNSGNGYAIYLAGDGRIKLDIAYIASGDSGVHVKYGQWNALCLVRRASDSKWILFVNGRKQSTNIPTNNSFGPNQNYTIGSNMNSSSVQSNPFVGEIATAAFWDVPLTDAVMFGLTSMRLDPRNVLKTKLRQFHELKSRQSTEVPLFVGSSLTATGTANSTEPRPRQLTSRRQFMNSFITFGNAAAVSAGQSRNLLLLGVG